MYNDMFYQNNKFHNHIYMLKSKKIKILYKKLNLFFFLTPQNHSKQSNTPKTKSQL